MTKAKPKTEIFRNPQKIKNQLVVSIFVLIGCIWLVLGGGIETMCEPSIYISWLGTGFFGLVTILLFHRLHFGISVPLTVSEEGILDIYNTSEPIAWAQIRSIRLSSVRSIKMLVIDVSEEDLAEIKTPAVLRVLRYLNYRSGFKGVWIHTLDLNMTSDELYELVSDKARFYDQRIKVD